MTAYVMSSMADVNRFSHDKSLLFSEINHICFWYIFMILLTDFYFNTWYLYANVWVQISFCCNNFIRYQALYHFDLILICMGSLKLLSLFWNNLQHTKIVYIMHNQQHIFMALINSLHLSPILFSVVPCIKFRMTCF